MRRRPRALEHPAAGARAAERPDLRRGRPRLRRAHPQGRRRRDGARIAWAWRQATAREPAAEEVAGLARAARASTAPRSPPMPKAADAVSLGSGRPEGIPAELAAWTNVARAILNLHETITRNGREWPLASRVAGECYAGLHGGAGCDSDGSELRAAAQFSLPANPAARPRNPIVPFVHRRFPLCRLAERGDIRSGQSVPA